MEQVTIRNYNDWQQAWGLALAEGLPCAISIGEQRTSEQNDKLHPLIRDIQKQCKWSICGSEPVSISEKKWRQFFIAMMRGEGSTEWCALPGGQVLFFSESSKDLRKKEFSEVLEIIYAFGSERGVVWSDPALKTYEQYREAA